VLRQPDVVVTYASDKQIQLKKRVELDVTSTPLLF